MPDILRFLHHTQADLLERVKTDKLILSYLHASQLGLIVEEVPGIILAAWRIVAICLGPNGLRLRESDEILVSLQFLLSAIMLGFQLCNFKDFIRLAEEQIEQERKLERAVQGASTELDTFAGVTPGEIMRVLRLRNMLGESLRRLGHRADLMLLRFGRFTGLQLGADQQEGGGGATSAANDELVAMSTGARVTASFARREQVGADAVRVRILRNNMVRDIFYPPPRHFCLPLWSRCR